MIQHCVLGSKISLYFLEDKLAIKVDEKGHRDRDKRKEIERQETLEKEFGCKFIRFNCDGKDYDVESSELNNHISGSNKNHLRSLS